MVLLYAILASVSSVCLDQGRDKGRGIFQQRDFSGKSHPHPDPLPSRERERKKESRERGKEFRNNK